MDRELASLDEQEKDELAALDKELSVARAISEEIVRKKRSWKSANPDMTGSNWIA